ncbi:hypothetical protein GDO81_021305 [Engystomops pustulosus]|uniref:Uncharacterized protein n=1 Tax=Engystomops pustulosus TaxID=76066 RepID=A0AAV6YW18_ENGPU|nr:hypothetical protein GDO81_021305 [Engystomops pustulosus]
MIPLCRASPPVHTATVFCRASHLSGKGLLCRISHKTPQQIPAEHCTGRPWLGSALTPRSWDLRTLPAVAPRAPDPVLTHYSPHTLQEKFLYFSRLFPGGGASGHTP